MKLQLQRKDIINIFGKAGCCGFIPVLSCILYCIFQGQSLGSIYLPNTASADDAIYYKMVEGMVNFGAPLGYFGYNESRAMFSSFGVWSPVLLMPWAFWGKLFGWNYFSPILCNICMLSLSLAVFAVLAKPTWKQTIAIGLLFLSGIPFTTYVLSGRPEIVGYSLITIMYGIVYNYYRHEKSYKLLLIFGIVTILTLMRPYFMLFLILPGILWICRSKISGLIGTALIIFFNLSEYILMTRFFSAPYFYSSMATDFIEAFKKDGFFAGCLFLIRKIYGRWLVIRWEMGVGIRQGFTDGQIYFACCLAMLLLFIWLVSDFVKLGDQGRNKARDTIRNIVLESTQMLSFVMMLLAIIVLYNIPEGSRHILVFLISFIVVAVMRDDRALERNILTLVAFVYLFVVKYDEDSLYRVPYAEENVIEEVENWRNQISSYVSLDYVDIPNYENVVIWVTEESVDGEKAGIPGKVLFALPKGMGISCCLPQYMETNIDGLKGRYAIMIPNGKTDVLFREKGMAELLREDSFVLYQTY